jgi:energy-coupling factor transporter ATP-binding protein EcfA2
VHRCIQADREEDVSGNDLGGEELWKEIVPKFIRVPLTLYKNRVSIERWVKRAQVIANLGKTNIAVLGRSGVGKSVLLQRLNGLPGKVNWNPPPPSREVEPAVLDVNGRAQIVRVIPGQTSRERYNGLHESLGKHRSVRGVIYVTDWGYTDERKKAVKTDMIAQQGLNTVAKIRDFNLERERRDFELVCERIRESVSRLGCPHWLMIVVNKADLFMNQIDEARAYYHPSGMSSFTAPLIRLINYVGASHLRCDAVPLSSWGESFEWGEETVPTRLAEVEARALIQNFVKHLDECYAS